MLIPKMIRLFFTTVILLVFAPNSNAQMRQLYTGSDPDNEIVKISFYSASQGYVAFDNWIGYTTDSGRTFIQKNITTGNVNFNGYAVNLTFGFQVLGVKSFSQNTLIAYGSYGLVPAILYSTNAGTSYTLVYHSQYDQFQLSTGITDIVFPQNGLIGYAVDADRILKTSNGGLNWSVIRTDPGSYFDQLDAVDDNNVLAMSTGYTTNKLLITTNAGASWQPVNIPALVTGKFSYAHFLTAGTGWISMFDNDNKYYFYKTINGGTSWVLQNDVVATPFKCSKMKFIDVNTGYALSGQNTVYKTSNSGVLWEPLPRDNNYIYLGYTHNDLQCLTGSQLWAGGGHGFLEMSTNGGGTTLPKSYYKIDTTGVNAGNIVNLVNYSNPAYQFKWYVNSVLNSTSYNSSFTHSLSSQLDSVTLLTTSGGKTDTLTKYQYFIVPTLPVISGFSPSSGSTGSFVTIRGHGFTNVTSVKFGGTAAASFSIIADTVITTIVANGASGNVSVTDIHGTFSWPGFTYFAPPVAAPPAIGSVSPASGPVGTTVTISGSNFGTSTSNNILFFGDTKATIISATATQVVCNVPPGASYRPISLLNKTTGLSCHSLKPFNVSFADSSNFTTHSFQEVLELPVTPSDPDFLVSKDLDGDGKPDFVCSHWYNNSTVHRNTSTPNAISFEPGVNIDVKGYSNAIEDLDGDGKPDIVGSSIVYTGNYGSLNVLKNTSNPGTISFAPALNLFENIGNGQVTIADMDNDGRNDVLAAYSGSGPVTTFQVAIARNTSVPGNLSFAKSLDFSTTNYIDNIAAGDLDGDGKKDFVAYTFTTSDLSNSSFSCFRNLCSPGNIAFAARQDFVVPGYPSEGGSIFMADYDNDGRLDVEVLNGDFYDIYRNTSTVGSISFAPVISIAIAGIGMGGCVSNVSGDSKPDLVAGNWSQAFFSLLENASIPGTITTKNKVSATGTFDPNFTSASDFDLDGKLDMVVSSWSENKISVYKNTIGAPVSFTVCEGAGTSLAADIAGTTYQWQQLSGSSFSNITDNANFSGTQSNTLVFSGTPAGWNGYKFRCVVDNINYSSTFSLDLKLVVPASIMISTANTTSCWGSNVNFTSLVVPGNAMSTSYQWFINGSNAFEYGETFSIGNLHNNYQVTCVLNTYDSCGNYHAYTSNIIVMTIIGEAGSLVISTPSNSFCAGMPVTFTAASASPALPYEWRISGATVPGETASTFTTSALVSGNYVYCIQSLAPGCSTISNQVNMSLVATCPCITNTWLGTVNNNWENAANWSCGTVPTASSVVVINSGTVVVSSNANVYSLTTGPGVHITVITGFNLTTLH